MAKGPVKTAEQATANWAAGMSSSQAQTKYKDGINRYTGNPMAEAAKPEALQLYADKCARSVSSGRRAAKLNAASVSDWKTNAVQFGPQGMSNAANKKKGKYNKGVSGLQGVWQQQRDSVAGMPKGGLAAAQARQNRALEIMMQHAGTA